MKNLYDFDNYLINESFNMQHADDHFKLTYSWDDDEIKVLEKFGADEIQKSKALFIHHDKFTNKTSKYIISKLHEYKNITYSFHDDEFEFNYITKTLDDALYQLYLTIKGEIEPYKKFDIAPPKSKSFFHTSY